MYDTHVATSHSLRNVLPYANVVREFLLHNLHPSALGTIKVPTEMASPAKQRFVPFNLPRHNRGLVDCKVPERSDEQDEECEEGQEICNVEKQKMYQASDSWTEILWNPLLRTKVES